MGERWTRLLTRARFVGVFRMVSMDNFFYFGV